NGNQKRRCWLMKKALIGLLVLSALGLTACGGSGGSTSGDNGGGSGPITIGAAIAESGFMTAYDGPSSNALKMQIDEINAEGGIDGRKIKLITADTASKPEQGKSAADDVIEKGAEMVVV